MPASVPCGRSPILPGADSGLWQRLGGLASGLGAAGDWLATTAAALERILARPVAQSKHAPQQAGLGIRGI